MVSITLSILAFLDRYGIGTVPFHLSTSFNESLILYRSVMIRDPIYCGSRSGTKYSATVWSAQFVMWTCRSVPFRNRNGRTRLRTDPNCTGTVCTGTAPDVDSVHLRSPGAPLCVRSFGSPRSISPSDSALYAHTDRHLAGENVNVIESSVFCLHVVQ